MKKSIKSIIETIVTITLATLCVACNPASANAETKDIARTETTATGTLTTYADGTGYYTEKSTEKSVITETVGENLYPMTGLVTKVTTDADESNDTVTIICCNGNVFEFYAPHSDCWDVFDLAACIVDNNGTIYVDDDKILSALYVGSIEQFQEKVD